MKTFLIFILSVQNISKTSFMKLSKEFFKGAPIGATFSIKGRVFAFLYIWTFPIKSKNVRGKNLGKTSKKKHYPDLLLYSLLFSICLFKLENRVYLNTRGGLSSKYYSKYLIMKPVFVTKYLQTVWSELNFKWPIIFI